MTIQEFRELYTIVRPISDRGAHSFLATASHGKVVMVHVLDIGSKEERRALEARLDSLSPDGRDRVVDVIEVEEITIVVTRFMLDFDSFTEWIEGHGTQPPERPWGRGEFTKLFLAAEDSEQQNKADWSNRPASEVGDRGSAANTGSDVSRVFRAASTPRAGDPPPPRTPDAPVPEPDEVNAVPMDEAPDNETGEFTRMFRAGSAPSDEPVEDAVHPAPDTHGAGSEVRPDELRTDASRPTPARAANEPGEFTRMFRAAQMRRSDGSPGPDNAEKRGPTPPPEEAPATDPGEFTRMFRAVKGPTEVTSEGSRDPATGEPDDGEANANDASRGDGAYTRMFRTQGPAPDADSSAESGQADSTDPPAERRGLGDFTKMFQALSGTPLRPQTPEDELRAQPPPSDSESYLDRLYHADFAPARPVEPSKPVDTPQASPPRELPPLPSEMATKAPTPQPEPGTYTRIVNAAQKPPAASAAPPATPPSNSRPIILFGLAVVVMVTLVLIVYILLRTQLMPATTEAVADSAAVSVPAEPEATTP